MSGEREDAGERMDHGGREQPSSYYEPDYQPSPWYTVGYWNSPVAISSSSSSGGSTSGGSSYGGSGSVPDAMDIDLDMDDNREQDDVQLERETDHGDTVFDRAVEPLKRVTAGKEDTTEAAAMMAEDSQQQNQAQGEENPSKRRLAVPGTTATSVAQTFFNSVPPLTERAQAIVEYTAPSTFTPLYFFVGYTPFAIWCVVVMYICHAIQCFVTVWGHSPDGLTSESAWMNPLFHLLVDTYVWNQSAITLMLLKPVWYDGGPEANATVSAYTMACFFTMGQQMVLMLVSLQAHYERHKHELVPKARPDCEQHLMDTFFMYALAEIFFVVAGIFDLPWLLYTGLVYFNAMPLYLVYAHKRRMDRALKPELISKEPKKTK